MKVIKFINFIGIIIIIVCLVFINYNFTQYKYNYAQTIENNQLNYKKQSKPIIKNETDIIDRIKTVRFKQYIQNENNQLKYKNNQLKKKNKQLKQEKRQLEQEKQQLKQEKQQLEQIKEIKEQYDKINNALKIDFFKLSPEQIVNKLGYIFTEEQRRSNILASVSMAQFLLESGFGKSELAQKANNYFGMKATAGSTEWKGKTYEIYTSEEVNGKHIKVKAKFKVYNNLKESIEDHTNYLLTAKIGNTLRYNGLVGETDYKKAITIIKNGGYATSSTYIESICSLIERYNLTKFDLL